MQTVCLIDYGAGNLHSARRGLERAAGVSGLRIVASAEPEAIRSADRLVLPGVGAFRSCMEGLRARPGAKEAIGEAVARGTPFLGICVGMQLLADRGLEHEETQGLGLIPGMVRELKVGSLRLPHMGWNDVASSRPSPLVPKNNDAYFVHSFCFDTEDESDVIATCAYGEQFAAAVQRENVAGAQFHPEKSGPYGMAFLANFLGWRP
ncbi:imidazole glycerol phosphate synthase subunit HisH [Parvularcula maris]|uniref:Imidazole glycerol phosphate synthase subunit HisH n=1 Tax=Parvularcula maris TaxID=2965077 RepID=A0A9X2RHM5_9PROT|nr:imidazole glycerol phosphate synthase subunit HisH [Parvularcula maris]MCQ8184081.1 imidazole glycerol phosphate synthase subunit HisH [Parvularcula maris]